MSRPSNGTMMDIWLDRWCFRCVHDHAVSHVSEAKADYDKGCEVLARLYISDHDEPIPEMTTREELNVRGWTPDSYECRLFERCPCQDEGGWEPPKAPVPDPNQGLLFEVIDESPGLPMFTIPVSDRTVEALPPVSGAGAGGGTRAVRFGTGPALPTVDRAAHP